MPPDHLYQYRWLAVIVSVYPSCTVDLTAQKLPGMAWYIFDAEFRRQAFYNLSIEWGGTRHPSLPSWAFLNLDAVPVVAQIIFLMPVLYMYLRVSLGMPLTTSP